MDARDDRLFSVRDSLHLSPKMACLCLKNAAACLAGGQRARMGKMHSYGPWEIPPLFAITVAFQNSAVLRDSCLGAGAESSYYLISSRAVTQTESKRPICANLGGGGLGRMGQEKNQISITVLRISKAS